MAQAIGVEYGEANKYKKPSDIESCHFLTVQLCLEMAQFLEPDRPLKANCLSKDGDIAKYHFTILGKSIYLEVCPNQYIYGDNDFHFYFDKNSDMENCFIDYLLKLESLLVAENSKDDDMNHFPRSFISTLQGEQLRKLYSIVTSVHTFRDK